jgi:pimeloyl-ACP methyl ester carboxylesterase
MERAENILEQPRLAEGSNCIDVEGCSLHYVVKGEGPPMVLLHGLGASIAVWEQNIDPLAQFFTVYALDLPGFGSSSLPPRFDYSLESYAETVYKTLRILKIDRAHLVGSSFGGAVAAFFSLRYPEKVHRLVVIGAVGYRAIASLNGQAPEKEADRNRGANDFHETPVEAVSKTLLALDEKALEDLEKKTLLGRAVMIITGESDPYIRREAICAIVARNPHAKCLIVPDANHLPHQEFPEFVNRNIVAYCTQADARGFCG